MFLLGKLSVRAANLSEQGRQDLRIALILAGVSIVLYGVGIGWGMPQADAPGKTRPWGVDEIGPIGPIVELANSLSRGYLGNPQYPMFHYMLVDLFYAPYLLLQWVTGGLVHPHAGYPFGFQEPARGVQSLLLIARSVSVLMGAGTVVVAFLTGKTLWGRPAGVFSALFVLLMYPMFYYARMSNVDVPAMFWTSLVLLLFARAMKDGLTVRRAVWLGLFAALAVGTKDQSLGLLLFLPIAMLPVHFRLLGERGLKDSWSRWKAPFAGLAVSALAYVLGSGLALRPEKFFAHLAFIRTGAPHYRFYFKYPATLAGYWALSRECLQLLVNALGWPILLAAIVGILIAVVRERFTLALLLPIPGLALLVLAPVRYVDLRFLIPWGFVLALFAGYAIACGRESSGKFIRILAVLALVSGLGLGLLRGADLTYAMHRDSRYDAARWLNTNAQTGDRIEYFSRVEALDSLPRIKPGPVWSNFWATPLPTNQRPQGEFVFAMGPDDLENHWKCPGWLYQRLRDGSLGYELAATFQTPTMFPHSLHWVNPRIEIFVRRDRARLISKGN